MLLNLMPRRFWETCSPASSSWSLTWPASTLLPLPQRVRQRGPFLCARDGGLHHVHLVVIVGRHCGPGHGFRCCEVVD
jgi:hypothetical protein